MADSVYTAILGESQNPALFIQLNLRGVRRVYTGCTAHARLHLHRDSWRIPESSPVYPAELQGCTQGVCRVSRELLVQQDSDPSRGTESHNTNNRVIVLLLEVATQNLPSADVM